MNLLAITTSTSTIGVWLRTDAGFDAGRTHTVTRGQPRPLTEAIWHLLAEAHLAPEELHCIACDTGPGSFTGLRMGLATARALAWAHAVPCVGVGSLATLVAAVRAAGWAGPCSVALPARAGVAYVGWSEAGTVAEEFLVAGEPAVAGSPQAWWSQRARGRTVAVAGAAWSADGWLRSAAGAAAVAAAVADAPAARLVADLAHGLPPGPALELLPRYLQASQAELRSPA